MAALRDLEGFTGRRIVVFDGTARQGDKPLVAEMESKLGETYLIDGGVPVTKTYQLDPFDRRGSPIPSDLSVTNQETKRVANYGQGIVHEPTFVDAIRDAYSDAGNYYDLSFAPISIATAASITLAIHGLTGTFFDARLYEVESVPPSDQKRINTVQTLTVQEK